LLGRTTCNGRLSSLVEAVVLSTSVEYSPDYKDHSLSIRMTEEEELS